MEGTEIMQRRNRREGNGREYNESDHGDVERTD